MTQEQKIRHHMMMLFSAVLEQLSAPHDRRNWTSAMLYFRCLGDALARQGKEHILGGLQTELLRAEAGHDAPSLEDKLREVDAIVAGITDPSPVKSAMAGALHG